MILLKNDLTLSPPPLTHQPPQIPTYLFQTQIQTHLAKPTLVLSPGQSTQPEKFQRVIIYQFL